MSAGKQQFNVNTSKCYDHSPLTVFIKKRHILMMTSHSPFLPVKPLYCGILANEIQGLCPLIHKTSYHQILQSLKLWDTGLDIKHLVYMPVGHVVLKIYVPCKNFSVWPKNFNGSSDNCPMGFIYSIEIYEISHRTFGPSHRKCPTCPTIFMNTDFYMPSQYLCKPCKAYILLGK